jgi:osmotically-inducible protein OsmY
MTFRKIGHVMAVGTFVLGIAACDNDRRDSIDRDDTVRGAGETASEAARDAGSTMGAAIETADIKSALTLDDVVDASGINVDTNGDAKVVVLKGTVPTEDQRVRAETIAQREAPGYRVDNQLVVRMP